MASLVHQHRVTDPSHDDHYGRRLSEAQAMMRDHLQACGYCEQAAAARRRWRLADLQFAGPDRYSTAKPESQTWIARKGWTFAI